MTQKAQDAGNSIRRSRWLVVVAAISCLCSVTLASNLLGKSAANSAQEAGSFSVSIVRAVENTKILPNEPSLLKDSSSERVLHVTAAPGEYEPASFVVHANRQLEKLTVGCSGLRSANSELTSANMDIRIVKPWFQGCVSGDLQYTHCPDGTKRLLMPELLLHDSSLVKVDLGTRTNYLRITDHGADRYIDISRESGDPLKYKPNAGPDTDMTMPDNVVFDDSASLLPVDVPAGENLQFWVTLHVPAGTPPGKYEGKLDLSSANAGVSSLPFQVDVLPFTLDRPLLEYGLYYRARMMPWTPSRVGSEEKGSVQLQAEMADMVKHGVTACTVTQSFDPSRPAMFGKFLKIMKGAGMGDNLYMLWTGEYYKDPGKTRRLLAFAGKAGFKNVYFYGGDELDPAQAKARRESWKNMKSLGGKIFSALEKAAYEVPDILDLAVVDRIRDPKLARAYHDHGGRVFSYGAPQVGVEEPATYRRSYGFALWKAGYDGVMDYAYQHAWGCIWNDFDGYSRDHVFAYPTTHGVIDTIEWEGFREAVDDVRYLTTLLNHIAKAKALHIPTGDIERWLDTIDPKEDQDLTRKGIVERILKLKMMIDQLQPAAKPAVLPVELYPVPKA